MDEVRDMDAVILAVAHDEFKNMSVEKADQFFGDGKKVFFDIKGICDREEFENAGYSYWRL
jgi:UDP-N-acetyl-D-galactosamine dehydrogenase